MKKISVLLIMLIVSINIFADTQQRTIEVVGVGKLEIKPDTVVISTGVENGDPEIGKALKDNTSIMDKIMEGLADLGIAEDRIETSNYNVYLFKPYNEDSKEKEEYRVSNSITINIENVELVDTVIDTLVTLGANKIKGVYFTVGNVDKYKNELRNMALLDARNQAEFIAEATNMNLKSVISIKEMGLTNGGNNYTYAASEQYMKSSFAPGSEELSISYHVVYEITTK